MSGLGSAGKSVSSAGLNRSRDAADRSPIHRPLGPATDASTARASCERRQRTTTQRRIRARAPTPRLALRWCDADAGRRAVGRRRTDRARRGSAGGSGRTTARARAAYGSRRLGRVPGDIPGDGGRDVHATPRAGWESSARRAPGSSSSSFAISSSNVTWCRVAGDGPRPPPPPPSSSSVALALGRPFSLSMPAGLTVAGGAGGGRGAGASDGCASPSSSASLRRFSLSADAEGRGCASFVASAAVDARSASAASAANLLIALPFAPPPVAGALRAALTVRRSPTAAGPAAPGWRCPTWRRARASPAPSAA